MNIAGCAPDITLPCIFFLAARMLIYWRYIIFKLVLLFFSISFIDQDSWATLFWSPLHKQMFLGGVFRRVSHEEFLTQLAFAKLSSPFFLLVEKKRLATTLKT